MRLRGKVAVITGGGRGLGEAVALAFAREGAHVLLASRTASELTRVQSQVRALGGTAETVAVDIADPAGVRRLADISDRHFGRVDILVNAAGMYGPIGLAWEVDSEAWIAALHVNLVGTFLCCRAFVSGMIERRWGRIINFSGGGATAPLPHFSAYGVSKAAVVRLTDTLAEELRPFNVQVNAIAPGLVNTRLQDEVLVAQERAGPLFGRIQQLKERGEGGVPPDLAAGLAVFLASDASNGLTGKLIAAPFDAWQKWDPVRIREIMAGPWFTLRRIDPHTLQALPDLP